MVDIYNPGPNYKYKGNHPKKMMKINENGEKEELFEDKGVGKIFVLGDRMYLREIDFDSENQGTGVSRLYSVDFSGQNRKNYGTGEFNYADEKSNKIIYSTYDNIVVINDTGEEEFKIPDGRFLSFDKQDCIIYYEKYHENRDNPDDKSGALQLWAINIDGSNNKMLNAVTPEYEYRSSCHEMEEIANLQIKDDYIYISYGYYAGTGHFYTGKIARMKKDGTSLDILTESDVKDFFILEKEGVDYLIFSKFAPNSGISELPPDSGTPDGNNFSMNLNNKEVSPTKDFLPCSLDEPFEEQSDNNSGDDKNNREYTVNYSIYTDNRGNKLQLISKNDFKGTLGNLYEDKDDDGDNDRYRKVEKVEYTGGCVYFSIEEGERNKEKDVGWRYSYKRIRTEVYQKNLKTSKITMINSY